MKRPYKLILSIDGGGIRGIIPLLMLRHIIVDLGQATLIDSVDVFSGTSTGAIIAAGLMQKDTRGNHANSVDSILELYRTRGKLIFDLKLNRKHQSFPLKKVLESNFKDMQLDNFQQHFLFPSFDLRQRAPFFFSDEMSVCKETTVVEMLLACSAIPGVFPAVSIGDKQLIDGLFVNKNPSLYALHYARRLYPNEPCILVSLGTGNLSLKNRDAYEKKASEVDEELQKISNSSNRVKYFRFQPNLQLGSDAMSDGSEENIYHLLKDVENYIHAQENRFQELVVILNKST